MNEIEKLRKEIEIKTQELKRLEDEKGFDPMGLWLFSTEGDIGTGNGRTRNVLGEYNGNLFEGIKLYAPEQKYKLTAQKIGDYNSSKDNNLEVHVVVYDNYIEMHNKEDTKFNLEKHSPPNINIEIGDFYGAVKIKWND